MKEDIFKKKWKVTDCFSGSDCWCRMVVTADWKKDSKTKNYDDEIIIGAAAINKKTAEYLVKIHNNTCGAIHEALIEQDIEQAKNYVLTDIKGISMRLFNLSLAARIETLGDLQQFKKEDFYKFNGIGKKTVEEIENLLKAHGLDFLY